MSIFILIILGGLVGGGIAVGMKRDVVVPAILGALAVPLIIGAMLAPVELTAASHFIAPQNVRFVAFLINVIGAMWAGILAEHRRRSVVGWALLGFFLPLFGVIFAALAEKQPDARESNVALGAA
ncbi:MAG TPA: hypothetical protein VGM90_02675 [Kofleriaceae bacterium]|jgi:hypothetical protein